MAIRNTTDHGTVALYDGTTGLAFGPIFDDRDAAEDFLTWAREDDPSRDIRMIPSEDLISLFQTWKGGYDVREIEPLSTEGGLKQVVVALADPASDDTAEETAEEEAVSG